MPIIDWNNLDSNLCSLKIYGIFKKNILKSIRPKSNIFLTAAILRGLDWSFTWAQIQLQFPELFKSTLQLWFEYWICLSIFSVVLYLMIKNIPSWPLQITSILNITVNRSLFNTNFLIMVVLRLIQKQTRLFLTQPLTIFYPL